MATSTPLLDTVASPADTRGLSIPQLRQLAEELRAETIDAVSQTGGHLGAGLGVVELTVALHHVYETPRDILIWDVGHQAYPHKILPGRRGACVDLHLSGPWLLRGARRRRARQQGGGRDRRRRHERRHGLRGDE